MSKKFLLIKIIAAFFLLMIAEIYFIEEGIMGIILFINQYGVFFQTIILSAGIVIAIRQLSSLNRQLKGNSLQQIHFNDREIKTLRFNNTWLLQENTADLSEDQKDKMRIFFNLLINHAKHIYMQKNLKAIPEEYWEAVHRDLEFSLNNPVFKEVWDRTKKYVPSGFKDYIDGLVLSKSIM